MNLRGAIFSALSILTNVSFRVSFQTKTKKLVPSQKKNIQTKWRKKGEKKSFFYIYFFLWTLFFLEKNGIFFGEKSFWKMFINRPLGPHTSSGRATAPARQYANPLRTHSNENRLKYVVS